MSHEIGRCSCNRRARCARNSRATCGPPALTAGRSATPSSTARAAFAARSTSANGRPKPDDRAEESTAEPFLECPHDALGRVRSHRRKGSWSAVNSAESVRDACGVRARQQAVPIVDEVRPFGGLSQDHAGRPSQLASR